tara:strand:+ start:5375 stop:6253 length:879 start_codon:yes stop_codon:yes gene_type:complete
VETLQQDIHALTGFWRAHPRLVVLTGAGISADSGIPTYRDVAGRWLHSEPIRHQDFIASAHARRRYWARSWHGWPAVRDARPNAAHSALAALENSGHVELLVTQNVDRLHQRAGSRRVVDLHGRLDRVRCLACNHTQHRDRVQQLLARENRWEAVSAGGARPDGDREISEELAASVVLPRCPACAGDLGPDVVFFGGNIPADRLQRCADALARADGLLAVGSSLQVFSGFRLCRNMHRAGRPVAIINPGLTRADDLAALKLRSPAGALLAGVEQALTEAAISPRPCAGDSPS